MTFKYKIDKYDIVLTGDVDKIYVHNNTITIPHSLDNAISIYKALNINDDVMDCLKDFNHNKYLDMLGKYYNCDDMLTRVLIDYTRLCDKVQNVNDLRDNLRRESDPVADLNITILLLTGSGLIVNVFNDDFKPAVSVICLIVSTYTLIKSLDKNLLHKILKAFKS